MNEWMDDARVINANAFIGRSINRHVPLRDSWKGGSASFRCMTL